MQTRGEDRPFAGHGSAISRRSPRPVPARRALIEGQTSPAANGSLGESGACLSGRNPGPETACC